MFLFLCLRELNKKQNKKGVKKMDAHTGTMLLYSKEVLAKELGKKIEYVGFSHRPSFAMQRYTNLSRLLSKIELEQFFPKTLFN